MQCVCVCAGEVPQSGAGAYGGGHDISGGGVKVEWRIQRPGIEAAASSSRQQGSTVCGVAAARAGSTCLAPSPSTAMQRPPL